MQRKVVLVVDDEQHIVKLLQVSFERAGCEVITAASGEEALLAARDHKPDVIVMNDHVGLVWLGNSQPHL